VALARSLAEAGETESDGLKPGRVVSVIAILAIVFIAIMACFASQMPEKRSVGLFSVNKHEWWQIGSPVLIARRQEPLPLLA
jgi:hypothetical protein